MTEINMDSICANCGKKYAGHFGMGEYCYPEGNPIPTTFKLSEPTTPENKVVQPEPKEGKVSEARNKIQELACDFAWENTFDHSDGYRNVRQLFDEWLQNTPYHNRFVSGLLEELYRSREIIKDQEQLLGSDHPVEPKPERTYTEAEMKGVIKANRAFYTKLEVMPLIDEMADAIHDLIDAVPKQTNDCDWWEDSLVHAVDNAKKMIDKSLEFKRLNSRP